MTGQRVTISQPRYAAAPQDPPAGRRGYPLGRVRQAWLPVHILQGPPFLSLRHAEPAVHYRPTGSYPPGYRQALTEWAETYGAAARTRSMPRTGPNRYQRGSRAGPRSRNRDEAVGRRGRRRVLICRVDRIRRCPWAPPDGTRPSLGFCESSQHLVFRAAMDFEIPKNRSAEGPKKLRRRGWPRV